jgi:hypothetical protein
VVSSCAICISPLDQCLEGIVLSRLSVQEDSHEMRRNLPSAHLTCQRTRCSTPPTLRPLSQLSRVFALFSNTHDLTRSRKVICRDHHQLLACILDYPIALRTTNHWPSHHRILQGSETLIESGSARTPLKTGWSFFAAQRPLFTMWQSADVTD